MELKKCIRVCEHTHNKLMTRETDGIYIVELSFHVPYLLLCVLGLNSLETRRAHKSVLYD